MNNYCQNKNGFTLIETLIVLGILSFLLAISFSLLQFGNTSFTKGENRSNTQSSFSLYLYKIEKTTRTSTVVEIINSASVPATVQSTDSNMYLYINNAGSLVIKKYNSPDTVITSGSGNLSLIFTGKDTKVLNINLTDTASNLQFSTSVFMVNLGVNRITGLTSGSALKFIAPST